MSSIFNLNVTFFFIKRNILVYLIWEVFLMQLQKIKMVHKLRTEGYALTVAEKYS